MPNRGNLTPNQSGNQSGNNFIDENHMALITHINRFYVKHIEESNVEVICNELRLLGAYSEYHFSAEESLIELPQIHKANHIKLLNDLDTLTDELRSGKNNISTLGDYLDYWLLNHIRAFDVPTFKSN